MKICSSVYGPRAARPVTRRAAFVVACALLAPWPGPPAQVQAQPTLDPVVEARDALRRKDRAQLAAMRNTAVASRHPLAMWADYWELSNRLPEVSQSEVEGFYQRWAGSYVEDRLRNDWLLELGLSLIHI